ncbi:hypothetical protein [Neisseria sp. S1]|uniref:hypothetical protein n=1 Tax=Neisseria sp. S1 TaxID=3318354 RepID=UPI003A884112
MIQTANISLYRGDTHIIRLALSADSTPVDLSGAVLALDIVPTDGSPPIRPEIGVQGNIVTLYFAALLTHDIKWERAQFDLRVVYGAVVKTYLRGTVFVRPSITPVADLITIGGKPIEQHITVDISGQAVIVQQSGKASESDINLIEDLKSQIASLKQQDADDGKDIAKLDRRLALAEVAISENGSLLERLAALEQAKSAAEVTAAEVAALKLRLATMAESAEIEAIEGKITAVKQQLNTELAKVSEAALAANESVEIAELRSKLATLHQQLEAAQALALAADDSAEIAELRNQLETLQTQVQNSADTATQIQELRNLLRLPKREKIHVRQDMWADGGYTWARIEFANTYADPRISVALEHSGLSTQFLVHNVGGKTSTGCYVRSNFTKADIDVRYSIFVYVEEWGA